MIVSYFPKITISLTLYVFKFEKQGRGINRYNMPRGFFVFEFALLYLFSKFLNYIWIV